LQNDDDDDDDVVDEIARLIPMRAYCSRLGFTDLNDRSALSVSVEPAHLFETRRVATENPPRDLCPSARRGCSFWDAASSGASAAPGSRPYRMRLPHHSPSAVPEMRAVLL